MTELITLDIDDWQFDTDPALQSRATAALEEGHVLHLPRLRFTLQAGEQHLLSPAVAAGAKNISLDPGGARLRGSAASDDELEALRSMMQRYAQATSALLARLLPRYQAALARARTSFRPQEIAGRPVSWRQDDSRLHVDAFPSSPTRGDRILRVFANVHPQGQARHWLLGDSFEAAANEHLPTLSPPPWGLNRLLRWLRVTKRERSAYDHLMLQLHDRMKADLDYQARTPKLAQAFAAGSTWIVYTDATPHAAVSGQHALEQTFHLPVASMERPALSPLRVLERLMARPLA